MERKKGLCSQFLERARDGYPVRAELDNGVRRLGTLGCGQWGPIVGYGWSQVLTAAIEAAAPHTAAGSIPPGPLLP